MAAGTAPGPHLSTMRRRADDRRDALGENLRSRKQSLEGRPDSSLESATELATTIRRGQREQLREA